MWSAQGSAIANHPIRLISRLGRVEYHAVGEATLIGRDHAALAEMHCRHPPPPPPASALQGVGVQEVLRALADAIRVNDKAGRAQLVALLLRLFFFEELPPEAVQLFVPLFRVGKGTWVLRWQCWVMAGMFVATRQFDRYNNQC